jgi:hypothetical protein
LYSESISLFSALSSKSNIYIVIDNIIKSIGATTELKNFFLKNKEIISKIILHIFQHVNIKRNHKIMFDNLTSFCTLKSLLAKDFDKAVSLTISNAIYVYIVHIAENISCISNRNSIYNYAQKVADALSNIFTELRRWSSFDIYALIESNHSTKRFVELFVSNFLIKSPPSYDSSTSSCIDVFEVNTSNTTVKSLAILPILDGEFDSIDSIDAYVFEEVVHIDSIELFNYLEGIFSEESPTKKQKVSKN